jgi:hypothetical protein
LHVLRTCFAKAALELSPRTFLVRGTIRRPTQQMSIAAALSAGRKFAQRMKY